MASASSSSIQKGFKYDVFLSFRGEETRKSFVDHLYHALVNRCIITYKDDEKIEKGERISEQLIRSIEESRFYIIVFSKNYASSSWCLDELVEILKCQETKDHTAYPVFYDVEPSEVRNQSGAVGEAFAKHVGKEAAGKWRDALKEAAGLAGMELKNTADGREAKLIKQIVGYVSLELRSTNLSLVGMENRVNRILPSLEIDSYGVRMIVIKGIGGVGKTTLAKVLYDRISGQFEGKTFLENVRQVSKGSSSGLKGLQQQVLKDVLNDQSIHVESISEGENKMKKMMGSRKVLLVLDDVDRVDQLEALAGESAWFKPGSRIIITTRDEQLLVAHGVHRDNIHEVNLLSDEEAICLLSRHAFGIDIPIHEYEGLSREVVRYAAGLPLTIKVLGSHLCGRSEPEWVDAIKRLKTIPLGETLKKLEISYDGLDHDQQDIFLDVACILKGEMKATSIRVLESCELHAEIGLRVLELKSLITISDDGCLGLHDLLQEMGRNIVRRSRPKKPYRHSRLWIKEEIQDLLLNDLGTKETRCIKLEDSDLDAATVMQGLRKMSALRILYVDTRFNEVDEIDPYLPNSLRSLHWPGYPLGCLPNTFHANKLANLAMVQSNICEIWEGGEMKALKTLKFLDLKHSENLRTFNLGMTPDLEMLDLKGCDDFLELYMPITLLNLKFLNLSGSKVSKLDLGLTPNLEELYLGECDEFVELHMPVECPKLKYLNLSGSKVSNLNLGLTSNLSWLNLQQCYFLQEIHAPVGCLKKLDYLNLSGCLRFEYFLLAKSSELPGLHSLAKLKLIAESLDICPLHPNNNLPKFQFKCFYDEPASSWSGNIEKLISFGLCACTNLESFAASICGLQHLRELTLEGNVPEVPKDLFQLDSLEKLTLSTKQSKHLPDKHLKSGEFKSYLLLEELPEDLGLLESLKELSLSMKGIKHLPDSICMLKYLKSLDLKSCFLLERLPTDLYRLESLEKLHLSNCISLREIPNSICNMKCLKYLHLPYCILVENLPEELGCLEFLKELNIEGTSITHLPQSVLQSKGLRIVWSRERLRWYGFTSLTKTSKYTASCYV